MATTLGLAEETKFDELIKTDHLTSVIRRLMETMEQQQAEIGALRQEMAFIKSNTVANEELAAVKRDIELVVAGAEESTAALRLKQHGVNEFFRSEAEKTKSALSALDQKTDFTCQMMEMHAKEIKTNTDRMEHKLDIGEFSSLSSEVRRVVEGIQELSADLADCPTNDSLELIKDEGAQRTEEVRLELAELRKQVGTATEDAATQLQEQVKSMHERLTALPTKALLENAVKTSESKVLANLSKQHAFITERVEAFAVRLQASKEKTEALSEITERKADKAEIRQLRQENRKFAELEDLEAVQKKCTELINMNTKELAAVRGATEQHGGELQQQQLKLAAKSSKDELTMLKEQMAEMFTTPQDVTNALRPTTIKIDRLIGKLVDFGRLLEKKAELETTQHLDVMLHQVMEKLRGAPIGEGIAGNGGGVGDAASTPNDSGAGGRNARGGRAGASGPGGEGGGGDAEGSGAATLTPMQLVELELANRRVLEFYTRMQAELEFVHVTLAEVREIMEGRKGVALHEQHHNHAIWQQMIAFRKLFILTGEGGTTSAASQPAAAAPPAPPAPGVVSVPGPEPPTSPAHTSDPSPRRGLKAPSEEAGAPHVFRTPIERRKWEREEQQRWLVETRMNQSGATPGGSSSPPSTKLPQVVVTPNK